jgi:hypothetical protein
LVHTSFRKIWVFMTIPYRDKKVVGVFVRFRAPFNKDCD